VTGGAAPLVPLVPLVLAGLVAWSAAAASRAVASLVDAPALARAGALGGPRTASARDERRRRSAVERDLAAALEAVARSLRSGAALPTALRDASGVRSPVAIDLRLVVADLPSAGLVVALERWADRTPTPGVRLAVAALAMAGELGGAAAAAVDGVAGTLRQRQAGSAEVRALSTQARLSAWVVAAAPLGFLVLTGAADRRTVRVLTSTPLGLACLLAGLALDALGAAWMVRITRQAA